MKNLIFLIGFLYGSSLFAELPKRSPHLMLTKTENEASKDITVEADQTLTHNSLDLPSGRTYTVEGTLIVAGTVSGTGTMAGTGTVRSMAPGEGGSTAVFTGDAEFQGDVQIDGVLTGGSPVEIVGGLEVDGVAIGTAIVRTDDQNRQSIGFNTDPFSGGMDFTGLDSSKTYKLTLFAQVFMNANLDFALEWRTGTGGSGTRVGQLKVQKTIATITETQTSTMAVSTFTGATAIYANWQGNTSTGVGMRGDQQLTMALLEEINL